MEFDNRNRTPMLYEGKPHCWKAGCHLKKMDLVAIRRHEKVAVGKLGVIE